MNSPLTARLNAWLLLTLIVLCTIWELWGAPLRPGGSWLAIKAIILIPLLPRIAQAEYRAHQVLSLWILCYVFEGVLRASSDPSLASRLWAGAEFVLASVLFVRCLAFARAFKRLAQAATTSSPRKARPSGRTQGWWYASMSAWAVFALSPTATQVGLAESGQRTAYTLAIYCLPLIGLWCIHRALRCAATTTATAS